jgi:hypothetical protein
MAKNAKARSAGLIAGGLAIAAGLIFSTAAPAMAWGGATYFAGGNCSGYSVKSSSSYAGANTIDQLGAHGTITVAFRSPNSTNIGGVSGTSIVITRDTDPSVISILIGGHHTCRGYSLST